MSLKDTLCDSHLLLPTPDVDTKTLGFFSALTIASTRAKLVLIRLALTVCLKPAVHFRFLSKMFWPAKLTTAMVFRGSPVFSRSDHVMQ